jgi:hypothetical protein
VENVWQASVESPHTGERLGLLGLDDLFAFLQGQTHMPSDGVETIPRAEEAGKRTAEPLE